jgi:hypothetical protein
VRYAAIAALLLACSKLPVDTMSFNQRPLVAIEASSVSEAGRIDHLSGLWRNRHVARMVWEASDPDGEIVLFRYAIDDTLTAGAWLETTAYDVELTFSADDSARVDSIYVGSSTVPIERYIFNGAHTFFLKAVDDEGLESPPVSISFTAETIAPESEITDPSPNSFISLGPTFPISWRGHDPDGTQPPVGFQWRLVRADDVITMTDAEIEQALLDPSSPGDPWSAIDTTTTLELIDLVVPAHYLFGVRAIDEAGALEPRLRTFRSPSTTNVLLIRADETGGEPMLRVSSPVKSTLFPTSDLESKTFRIPANTPVLFEWEGDASHYGGRIAGYAYGIDCTDLTPENPCWSPESIELLQTRLHFTLPPESPPEQHMLYIRARDHVGSTMIADVHLEVIPLRFERQVVYVDDWGRDHRGRTYPDIGPICQSQSQGGEIPDELVVASGSIPPDQCHDAFLRRSLSEALAAGGHADWVVDRWEVLDPIDGIALSGDVVIDSLSHDYWVLTGPVTLEHLGRYRLVIWNTRSFPSCALKRQNSEAQDNVLAAYLEGGGNVWLNGTGTFINTVYGDFSPGLTPFGFRPQDFTYRFLKVQSEFGAEPWYCENGCFRQVGSSPRDRQTNGFEGAYTSEMAHAEGFPALRVAREPYANNVAEGIPRCEAMVVPHGLEMNPYLQLFGGRLDTLYFYQSNWLLEGGISGSSWMDDGATGLRYSGADQGRLMTCGFPFFYFDDDTLRDLLQAGTSWLLAE